MCADVTIVAQNHPKQHKKIEICKGGAGATMTSSCAKELRCADDLCHHLLNGHHDPRGNNGATLRRLLVWSVLFSFSLGLVLGSLLPYSCTVLREDHPGGLSTRPRAYSRVAFVEGEDKNSLAVSEPKDNNSEVDGDGSVIVDNIYWGNAVERSLPKGFDPATSEKWEQYLKKTSAVKLESGCGRMQNRMVTFSDGERACVRYRQNTDQIQGELFSFYLAQALELPNLAPSAVSLVNLTDRLWQGVVSDMGSAQWNSNRPVVLTKYIPNLESASIPDEFKPSDRHLNRLDVERMLDDDGKILNHASIERLVELAQWSDLIVFDYLTGNLDRMVNNMYNYQWNANIMEAPAHNLARKTDSQLLVFLDNESGLLHGYRLLHKYEVYHSGLLDGLCLFRRSTAERIVALHESGAAGQTLNGRWERATEGQAALAEALPPLPAHTQTLLQERLGALVNHINRCRDKYEKNH